MSFEQFLIDKGFKKMILNLKTWQYEPADNHVLSTYGPTEFRYLKDDKEILWGLNERRKPPTLVSPRPQIRMKRDGVYWNQERDDAMNIVLKTIDYDRIYEAMYDHSIVFEVDG